MNFQTLKNDNTVLTLLDVCGSCITDIMYNFLFDRAIAIHEKTSMGLSEAYRQVLSEYVNESNTPKFYSVLLNTLHHYVRMSTIFNTISYPECISMYAGLFVPQMYVTSMTNDQKINILTMILGNTIRDFSVKIKNDYIGCIIDEHQDTTNIEILQDCVLKIIIAQRHQNYDKFIQSQKCNAIVDNNTPENKPIVAKKSNQRAQINSGSLVKLTSAFKKSIARKNALEKKNASLIEKNQQLHKQFNELKNMFLKQISVQKEQYQIIEDLKKQLTSATQSISTTASKHGDIEEIEQEPEEVTNHESDTESSKLDDMFSVEYV